jgi:hypothetical protein
MFSSTNNKIPSLNNHPFFSLDGCSDRWICYDTSDHCYYLQSTANGSNALVKINGLLISGLLYPISPLNYLVLLNWVSLMINKNYIHGEIMTDELHVPVKSDISVNQTAGSHFID